MSDWISSAIKKPGGLRASLGVKKGEKIPAETLDRLCKHGKGKQKKRACLARTLRGFHK